MRPKETGMRCILRLGTVIALAAILAGCFAPEEQRPGMHLRRVRAVTDPAGASRLQGPIAGASCSRLAEP